MLQESPGHGESQAQMDFQGRKANPAHLGLVQKDSVGKRVCKAALAVKERKDTGEFRVVQGRRVSVVPLDLKEIWDSLGIQVPPGHLGTRALKGLQDSLALQDPGALQESLGALVSLVHRVAKETRAAMASPALWERKAAWGLPQQESQGNQVRGVKWG